MTKGKAVSTVFSPWTCCLAPNKKGSPNATYGKGSSNALYGLSQKRLHDAGIEPEVPFFLIMLALPETVWD